MKLIRTPWSVILNLLLILLPWIIGAAFLYQFGQPALEQFKRFLGNPVTEMLQSSEALSRNPSEPIPYNRFDRQFQQISLRNSLSDTDQLQLRKTTHYLYRGLVRRLDTGRPLAEVQTRSDSFFQLLKNPLIDKIFPRPDLLETSLKKDLERLQRASNFPYHPARGLEQFINKTPVAEDLIRTYGEIYADQLFCDQMGGTGCGVIFEVSVNIVSQNLRQYLSNWPTIHKSLPSRAPEMLERLSALLAVHQRFGENISAYLEAPPWQSRHRFRAELNQFRERYREDLRSWYEQIIKQINYTPEQFTGSTPPDLLENLSALIQLEKRITEQSTARDLFWNDRTMEARSELAEHLRETYHWVQAHQRFHTDFSVARQGMNRLTKLLENLPGSEKMLAEEQKTLDEISKVYGQLKNDLNQRNYDQIADLIQRLTKQARNSDSALGWSIMLRSFLKNSYEKISRPGWQPLDEGNEDSYSRVVRAFGQAGEKLQIRALSNRWVERTILAMKSRRFNQLKHNIEQLISNDSSKVNDQLISDLESLLHLEELPEELENQPKKILFHTVLLERIQYSQTDLYQHFQQRIANEPVWKTQWQNINTLLQAQESVSPGDLLDRLDLNAYTNEVKQWLDHFSSDQPFVPQIREEMSRRLNNFFSQLEQHTLDRIRNPESGVSPATLIERIRTLSNATDTLQSIEGISYSFQGQPWVHLLQFRKILNEELKQAQNLKRGSLMSSNSSYQQFRSGLDGELPGTFPPGYDPTYEAEKVEELHRTIMAKAREIQTASENDWLVGWGGRVTGIDILEPWKNFLTNVNDKYQNFSPESLQQWIQSIKQQQEAWS